MLTSAGRILVTGGAGLIGSHVIWALNRRGIDDIIVSDLLGEDEKWQHLSGLRFAEYLDGHSLRDCIRTPDTMKEVSTVIHLGACSSTLERDAAYLLDNNYRFSVELAEWSLRRGARFVYASSAATYGSAGERPDDAEGLLTQWRPLNPYGYSKHLFDLHARHQGWLKSMTGLKFFNVFGPNEGHKGPMRSVVAKAWEQVRDSGKVQLFRSHRSDYRDGEQRRDFLYAKDAAEMVLHFALASETRAGIYNLGSGSSNTWLELAGALFRALELPEQIEFIDMPESLRAQYQYHTEAKIEKLRASGYTRTITPLRDAVADYVRHYLAPGRHLDSSSI